MTFNGKACTKKPAVGNLAPLLIDVLKRFGDEPSGNTRKAIDLGSGDGTESAYLLANNWHVLAIDGESAAFQYLKAIVPPDAASHLQTQVAKFEDIELPPADLIYAGYSLPFCHPHHFIALWNKIVNSINTGGRFAGQFFGPKDTWANNVDMTFLTIEQARDLFTPLEIEHLYEEDIDGPSTVGPKHWHVFHVIAEKV